MSGVRWSEGDIIIEVVTTTRRSGLGCSLGTLLRGT